MSLSTLTLARLSAPPEVLEVLHRIHDALAHAHLRSAILTGSAARGELSYVREDDRFELRSDIELYVVADNAGRARRAVRPMLDRVELDLRDRWSGVHVDAAFLTSRQLSTLPAYIRHFELKRNGITLVGEHLLDRVPEVTPENLDWRELNDTILWRLTTVLAALPTSWVARSAPLGREKAHWLARSLLDVTLWALPGLGVLLPTFAQRIEYWRSAAGRAATEGTPLPDAELLAECYDSRRRSSFDMDPDELLAHAVRAWSWAYGVATGRTPWPHRGAGAGFSVHDPLRRARFGVRALASHRALARLTAEQGYARPAAEAAAALMEAAGMLREGRDALSRIRSAARVMGSGVRGAEPVVAWADTRRSLLRYLDTVLARSEWEWRVAESMDP